MNKNCISPNTSQCLKGILCICVLAHHLYQFTGLFINTYFGHFLSLLGQYSVAVFIFISGYGLYKSYSLKGDEYVRSFLKKRFVPLYATYIVFVIIYTIYDFENVDLSLVLRSLTLGGTVVSFGWYFQLIYLLYIGFFLIFRFCPKPKLRCVLMLVFLAIYCAISIILKQNYIQYIPIVSFALGMITAIYDEKLANVIHRFRWAILSLSFAVFFAVYMIYVQSVISGRFYLPAAIITILFCIANLGIAIFATTISKIFEEHSLPLIANPVTQWLGRLSLEIYALQGIVLRTLVRYISNKALYIALSLIITIEISYLFYLARQALMRLFSKNKAA